MFLLSKSILYNINFNYKKDFTNDQVNRTKVTVNNGYPYAKNLCLLLSESDSKALETNKEVGSTVLHADSLRMSVGWPAVPAHSG